MLYLVPKGIEEVYPIEVNQIDSAGDLSHMLAERNHLKEDIFITCHPRVYDFLKILKPDVKIIIRIPRFEDDVQSNIIDIDKVEFDTVTSLMSGAGSLKQQKSEEEDFEGAEDESTNTE